MNYSEKQERELLVKIIKENNIDVPWNHQFKLGDELYTCPPTQYNNTSANCPNKWNRIINLVGEDAFKEKKILDVGCSEGYFAFEAANFANEVIGVDLDPIRIHRANLIKKLKKNVNCKFVCSDSSDLIESKFNITLALGILHRVSDPIGFIKEILDVLGFDVFAKEKLPFFSKMKFPRHMIYAKRRKS